MSTSLCSDLIISLAESQSRTHMPRSDTMATRNQKKGMMMVLLFFTPLSGGTHFGTREGMDKVLTESPGTMIIQTPTTTTPTALPFTNITTAGLRTQCVLHFPLMKAIICY